MRVGRWSHGVGRGEPITAALGIDAVSNLPTRSFETAETQFFSIERRKRILDSLQIAVEVLSQSG